MALVEHHLFYILIPIHFNYPNFTNILQVTIIELPETKNEPPSDLKFLIVELFSTVIIFTNTAPVIG